MRRSLAAISTAVTCLVAVAFLVPLTLLVGDVVRDRALAEAFRTAATIGPVLALTTERADIEAVLAGSPAAADGRTSVYLPDPTRSGPDELGTITALGPATAPRSAVLAAMRAGTASTARLPHGVAVLQPVALSGGRVAVVEVDVPDEVLERGVPRARIFLVALALTLVTGSVLLADRLAARVVRAAGRLRAASGRLGAGDLDVRLDPEGPTELREAAQAFNTMADRVGDLLAAERELAADLSHRLRTPLAGLVLTGRSLGPGQVGDQVRALTARLQQEIDDIIREARREDRGTGSRGRSGRGGAGDAGAAPGAGTPDAGAPGGGTPDGADLPRPTPRGSCDAGAVLRERLDFWGALAEDQGRPWRLTVPPGPAPAPVRAADLEAAVDVLLGNVFLHTPEGCGFEVELQVVAAGPQVVVSDDGPGIADPEQAVRRGASGAGSSGLGLDIAARLARSCGGRLLIDRSVSGGARITVELHEAPAPAAAARPRRRPRRKKRHSRPWPDAPWP